MTMLPALGAEYNPKPHIAVDDGDTVSLAIDVDTSLGFAQVDGGGNVVAASRSDCGPPVIVTDLAVSQSGNDVWISGIQGSWAGSPTCAEQGRSRTRTVAAS